MRYANELEERIRELIIEELKKHGLIPLGLGERVKIDSSGMTIEVSPSGCQYYFKDAYRYCVRTGPHNEHSLAKDKWESGIEKCVRCNFTLSAHIDRYCPVGGINTKFLSYDDAVKHGREKDAI